MPCQRHIGPHVDASLLCCATSQVMPMLFKSCCVVFIQFFRGLPGFLFVPLISQCTACLGSLLSSIYITCLSHLSLLSLWWDLLSPVVSVAWPSRYWLCPSMRYPSFFFGTCGVRLLAFSFVQLSERHNSAPCNINMTLDKNCSVCVSDWIKRLGSCWCWPEPARVIMWSVWMSRTRSGRRLWRVRWQWQLFTSMTRSWRRLLHCDSLVCFTTTKLSVFSVDV